MHFYSSAQRFTFPDISCNEGETLLIIGQSGVGKTTLLHILAGILKPQSGDVFIDDKNLYTLRKKTLDKFRGKNIGLVFQKPYFVKSISAVENLMLTQSMAGVTPDKDKVLALMDELNIADNAHDHASQMSQGELQRLSIARALINDPKLVLADEPTSALDDHNCDQVVRLLSQECREKGAALVIVTHDNRLKNIFPHVLELSRP